MSGVGWQLRDKGKSKSCPFGWQCPSRRPSPRHKDRQKRQLSFLLAQRAANNICETHTMQQLRCGCAGQCDNTCHRASVSAGNTWPQTQAKHKLQFRLATRGHKHNPSTSFGLGWKHRATRTSQAQASASAGNASHKRQEQTSVRSSAAGMARRKPTQTEAYGSRNLTQVTRVILTGIRFGYLRAPPSSSRQNSSTWTCPPMHEKPTECQPCHSRHATSMFGKLCNAIRRCEAGSGPRALIKQRATHNTKSAARALSEPTSSTCDPTQQRQSIVATTHLASASPVPLDLRPATRARAASTINNFLTPVLRSSNRGRPS
jgi:hypothetical protein